MESYEKGALCLLHSIKGIGNRSLLRIAQQYGGYRNFLEAGLSSIYRCGLSTEIIEQIVMVRKTCDPLQYLHYINDMQIRVVTCEDQGYPSQLHTIADPPVVLYYRGDISCASKVCLAMVGARRASEYGRQVSREMSRMLGAHGVVVVSGLARGIDSEAHRGVMQGGGQTIAVLGSGVDVIYPPEHRKLYENIVQNGAVISEFPVHTGPQPGNFPRRNRIISGLSKGVIIIEARLKSGALITADFALEQGRDVFAVPGPIHSKTSEGTNSLIKQGASPCTGIEDILEEYPEICQVAAPAGEMQPIQLNQREHSLLQALETGKCHADELLRRSKMPAGELSTVLLKLELAGIVQSLPGNYYVKVLS